MAESASNPFWRFIVGVAKVLNFINHLVFNLIMLVVVIVIFAVVAIAFAAKSGGGGIKPVLDKTALVIDLKGSLVEQYTSAPLQRAITQASGGQAEKEIQLRDVTQALALAKDDPRIARVVLLTDGFHVPGFAAMRELGAALREFRSSGKKVLAYGSGMEQKGYYLAAQADEVYLDPDGAVLIEGLGRYRLYYRQGLQDKLGVDVKLFRVGEFKSAAEPYILDAASPESREADLFWMNDLWNRYLDDVASARKLKREDLLALINEMPQPGQAGPGQQAGGRPQDPG
jgi:protease-4